MFRRQLAGSFVATAIGVALVCAVNLGLAGSQEQRQDSEPAADEKTSSTRMPPWPPLGTMPTNAWLMIEKMIAEYDLKPNPSAADPR